MWHNGKPLILIFKIHNLFCLTMSLNRGYCTSIQIFAILLHVWSCRISLDCAILHYFPYYIIFLRFSRLHDDFKMTFVQLQRYYVGYLPSLDTKFILLKCRLALVPNMFFLHFLLSSVVIINSNYSSLI